ncbi:hypothetical protein EHS13_25110 [Paenibacillus psychroresistens]|uniref:Ankyrin repeat domain-containing protein n=1 Tax=Paenibacillus psychroresistens TaxID=1778678 RepID=A0A6B8RR18_9BACL|nr:hypothetical protein [Paenibacillus psychroresistens]QGQ97933.1 hypothetical protein EHS13_25110 [Paenibacillus psychroresistens]
MKYYQDLDKNADVRVMYLPRRNFYNLKDIKTKKILVVHRNLKIFEEMMNLYFENRKKDQLIFENYKVAYGMGTYYEIYLHGKLVWEGKPRLNAVLNAHKISRENNVAYDGSIDFNHVDEGYMNNVDDGIENANLVIALKGNNLYLTPHIGINGISIAKSTQHSHLGHLMIDVKKFHSSMENMYIGTSLPLDMLLRSINAEEYSEALRILLNDITDLSEKDGWGLTIMVHIVRLLPDSLPLLIAALIKGADPIQPYQDIFEESTAFLSLSMEKKLAQKYLPFFIPYVIGREYFTQNGGEGLFLCIAHLNKSIVNLFVEAGFNFKERNFWGNDARAYATSEDTLNYFTKLGLKSSNFRDQVYQWESDPSQITEFEQVFNSLQQSIEEEDEATTLRIIKLFKFLGEIDRLKNYKEKLFGINIFEFALQNTPFIFLIMLDEVGMTVIEAEDTKLIASNYFETVIQMTYDGSLEQCKQLFENGYEYRNTENSRCFFTIQYERDKFSKEKLLFLKEIGCKPLVTHMIGEEKQVEDFDQFYKRMIDIKLSFHNKLKKYYEDYREIFFNDLT